MCCFQCQGPCSIPGWGTKIPQALQCGKTKKKLNSLFPNMKGIAYEVCCAGCVQLYLTLCDPMDGSPPGSSVPEISQARILEWAAISFSRWSSGPWDWTSISCISKWVLYHWATREAHSIGRSPSTLNLLPAVLFGSLPFFTDPLSKASSQLISLAEVLHPRDFAPAPLIKCWYIQHWPLLWQMEGDCFESLRRNKVTVIYTSWWLLMIVYAGEGPLLQS